MSENQGRPAPLAFQTDMVRHLKTEEPGLWEWFSSAGNRTKQAEAVRLDLLKTTYRIDPPTQPDLYRQAAETLERYGLAAPVHFYQAPASGAMNAGLAYVPGEVHIVLSGPVLGALSEAERRALLGHEMAHYLLFQEWGGDFLVAGDLLRGLCHEARPAAAHLESLRLFTLYAEVFADRGAYFITEDPTAAITTLLKMETGLADVSADGYLRQAEEIFAKGEVQADQLTHPEPYIRARALRLWADRGHQADGDLTRMIEGPWALERLDLLRQRRLGEATRELLEHFLAPAWLRSESLMAHARLFFDGFECRTGAEPGGIERLLAHAAPSLGDYVCFVLLDFVTVDRDATEAALAAALLLARRLGLAGRFAPIAMKELNLGKKQFARIDREAEKTVAQAAGTA